MGARAAGLSIGSGRPGPVQTGTAARVPRGVDRLSWQGSANVAPFRFLAGLTGRTKKVTLPGPCYIHYRAGRANISADIYPDLDDFWSDLTGCYERELAALAAAGS